MDLTCKLTIECIEDDDGLSFKLSRQGKNIAIPVYFMLLEYAKNELIIAMKESHEK